MHSQLGLVMVSALAIASLGGCGGPDIASGMRGTNYVGSGEATVEVKLGDASAVFGKDAKWDAIRVNELSQSGTWYLDFNDIALTSGAAMPATAYVSIEFASRPAVGTMKAKVTTEIYKPDRVNGKRVTSSTKDAEVTLDKVELVKGGALAGRITQSSDDMTVQGSFAVRLEDPPGMFSGPK